MKYIKTFEELTPHIFVSAAHKLADILRSTSKDGYNLTDDEKNSVQYTRATNLAAWGNVRDEYKRFGSFNIRPNCNVSRSNDPRNLKHYGVEETKPSSYHLSNINFKIIENQSINLAIYFIEISNITQGVNYANITLYYDIIIDPLDSNKFTISDLKIKSQSFGEKTSTHLFSDRQSALKFKRVIADVKNWKIDSDVDADDDDSKLKSLFMLRSTPDEYNKLFDQIRTISINRLYK